MTENKELGYEEELGIAGQEDQNGSRGGRAK